MNNIEFVEATSRLEKYFDKEYSPEQLKIMFDFLKEWDRNKYVRAINSCLKTCKYLPKLADILTANTDNFSASNKNKEIDYIECKKCNGEGFVKYYKKTPNSKTAYEYIALCTCENAKQQRKTNKYNLPTLEEAGL